MASRSSPTGALIAALVIAIPAASSAVAQEPTDLSTITVMAPRVTYQVDRDRTSAIPRKLEITEKSAEVEFSDLDLTRSADLYTLEERVAAAAARVCEELARDFPDGTPSPPICTRRATEDAMARVEQAARRANR